MGGGGKGGGGGISPVNITPTPSPYEESLARIANQTYDTTDPLRSKFISDWMGFLNPTKTLKSGATPTMVPQYGTVGGSSGGISGYRTPSGTIIAADAPNIVDNMWLPPGENSFVPITPINIPGTTGNSQITGYTPQYSESDYVTQQYNPANLPGYTPMYDISRRGLESQYNTAVQNAIASTPRGGAMGDALNKLNLARAESVGGLPGQISSGLISDQLNKAYGAAFNAPAVAISGLGAANQGYTSTQNSMINSAMQQQALAQSQSNTKNSGLGTLGLGVGSLVGSAFGSPWVGSALGVGAGKIASGLAGSR